MPETATRRYVIWLKALPGKPVFVGYPAGFDFLFVYWYLIRFAGESPFSFSALDIKTYAIAVLKRTTAKAPREACPNIGSTRIPIPTSPSTTPSNRVRCSAICLLRISASPSANRRSTLTWDFAGRAIETRSCGSDRCRTGLPIHRLWLLNGRWLGGALSHLQSWNCARSTVSTWSGRSAPQASYSLRKNGFNASCHFSPSRSTPLSVTVSVRHGPVIGSI